MALHVGLRQLKAFSASVYIVMTKAEIDDCFHAVIGSDTHSMGFCESVIWVSEWGRCIIVSPICPRAEARLYSLIHKAVNWNAI